MNKYGILNGKRTLVALFLIVFVASFLRLYKLNTLPVSLYWDEVSIGYNAYSIGETLRDEYGERLPLLFRAFNDYKMPTYIYFASIPIKLFGLNEFSVRFPSAFFGILTVFLAYFLSKELLGAIKTKSKYLTPNLIGLISAFLLSISPWHIQFSRGAFEANIALFFVILGLHLFLKGINSYKYFLFSLISLALAFYSYRSVFIFLPLLLIGMLIIWRREILKIGILRLILGLCFFTFLIFPIVNSLLHEGSARFQQTSISNSVEAQALESFQKGKPVNKKILYVQNFLQGYFSEFSPQFLFLSGDPQGRHSTRGMGLLYAWEIPFLVLGIWLLLKKVPFNARLTILLWILVFPIAAALSVPTPHALRTLNVLPVPQIIIALGIIYSIEIIPGNFRKTFICLLSIIIIIFLMNFARLYVVSNTKLVVSDWGDGYKQLYAYLIEKENQYEKIIVTGYNWQPYAYALFYKKFDPVEYQRYGNSSGFGKYYFGGTSWDQAVKRPELSSIDLKQKANNKKTLVALSENEYEIQKNNVKKIHEIKSHEGKLIFILAEVQ